MIEIVKRHYIRNSIENNLDGKQFLASWQNTAQQL